MSWLPWIAVGVLQCEATILLAIVCGMLFAQQEERRQRVELEQLRANRERLLGEQMEAVASLVDEATAAVAKFREDEQRRSAVPVRHVSSRHH